MAGNARNRERAFEGTGNREQGTGIAGAEPEGTGNREQGTGIAGKRTEGTGNREQGTGIVARENHQFRAVIPSLHAVPIPHSSFLIP
ncbi:MAG: hypothetical protein IJ089_05445, partial [Clostridia bacterium]|nr:hypothetical protein [Clostridia bacterium]